MEVYRNGLNESFSTEWPFCFLNNADKLQRTLIITKVFVTKDFAVKSNLPL